MTTKTDDIPLPAEIAQTISAPAAHADLERLHAAYAWARANNPLGRAELEGHDPFWVVTKHADVSQIGRDSQTFHNGDRTIILQAKATIDQVMALNGGSPHLVRTLVHVDDPIHKNLRNLTQSWFMPNSILKLDRSIRALAKATVDKMAAHSGQTCDVVQEVALHYPLHVVMDILGVPPEDEQRMLVLTKELFASADPELSRAKNASLSPKELADSLSAVVADFARYFDGLTADRRRNPRNDIATLLANAEIDGKPLDDTLRFGYYVIIATAGHDTTSSSIATALWALSRFPGLLSRLKANPSLIGDFVDEAVRWVTPVRHFMRTATVDTQLRGRKIAKGDWLMLCYGSANRDEEIFPDPFEFRIDRKPNRHLGFGSGAHTCLGQHLAKMEMRILFEEMMPRLQSIEAAGVMDSVASNFTSGPKRLPVHFTMS